MHNPLKLRGWMRDEIWMIQLSCKVLVKHKSRVRCCTSILVGTCRCVLMLSHAHGGTTLVIELSVHCSPRSAGYGTCKRKWDNCPYKLRKPQLKRWIKHCVVHVSLLTWGLFLIGPYHIDLDDLGIFLNTKLALRFKWVKIASVLHPLPKAKCFPKRFTLCSM